MNAIKGRIWILLAAACLAAMLFCVFPAKAAEDDKLTEIATLEDWNAFAASVAGGKSYYGETVRLTADINGVTTMVGGDMVDGGERCFWGTFDGNGHTLNVSIETAEQFAAPFRSIQGSLDGVDAVIKNLHVTGTIKTSAKFAGGIVAKAVGSCQILNCKSSVTIESTVAGDGTHGGLIGAFYLYQGTSGFCKIEGCVFDGHMKGTATTNCGGLVGWGQCASSVRRVSVTNCLFAPQTMQFSPSGSQSIARFSSTDGTVSNCFYTQPLGGNQGALMAEANELRLSANCELAEDPTVYNVSGITAYGTSAVLYDETIYSGPGSEIALNYTDELRDYEGFIISVNGEALPLNATHFVMPQTAGAVVVTGETVRTYTISVSETVQGGQVETSVTKACEGMQVVIRPKPARGYTMEGMTLEYENEEGETNQLTPAEEVMLTMPASDVILYAQFIKVPLVEEINNTSDWDAFTESIRKGADYAGATVTLKSNVSIASMAGTASNPFNGTFDGMGHTINANINGETAEGTAPFRYIENAAIRHVKVSGSITGGRHTAGLVGYAVSGENVIEDCYFADTAEIKTTNNTHMGGVVGHSVTSKITMRGVYFLGTITGYSHFAACLVGWSNGSVLDIRDCVIAAAHSASGQYHPIALKNPGSTMNVSVSNTYYTNSAPEIPEIQAQYVTPAVQYQRVTFGENVFADGEETTYSTAGLGAIGASVIRMTGSSGPEFFSGKGSNLTFKYTGTLEPGKTPIYKVNDQELPAGTKEYTMVNQPVTVTARTAKVYQVEIGTITDGTITANAQAAEEGSTVVLTLQPNAGHTADGMRLVVKYTEDGEQVEKNITADEQTGAYTFVMPAADVVIEGAFIDLASLTEIASEADWNAFAYALQRGAIYTGKTVTLTADISVDRGVGTESNPFSGTFNGNGHKITVTLASSEEYAAPFRYTKDAEIKNLTIDGQIRSSRKFASGFIGWARGRSVITNCCSDVDIISSVNGDGTHGGFIARQGEDRTIGALRIEGSIVTGSMTTGEDAEGETTNCGGFVGYSYAVNGNQEEPAIINCAYAPSGNDNTVQNGCGTFVRPDKLRSDGLLACTEMLGEAQGAKKAFKVTAGENVKIMTPDSTYSVTNITDRSFPAGDALYYVTGSTVQVSYTGTMEAGKTAQFSVNGETISGAAFPMPEADAEVTAALKDACRVSFDANGGTGTMEPVDVVKNEEYPLPACTFEVPSEGFRFAGWQVGDDAQNIKMPGQTVTITVDTTLKAVWKQIAEEVRYIDENGAKKTVPAKDIGTGTESYGQYCIGEEGKTTWYYVSGEFNPGMDMVLEGDVNLILTDGAHADFADKTIFGEYNNLRIYGQEQGSGKLTAYRIDDTRELHVNGGTIRLKEIIDWSADVRLNAGTMDVRSEGRALQMNSFEMKGGTLNMECTAERDWWGDIFQSFISVSEETKIYGGEVRAHVTIPEELSDVEAVEIRVLESGSVSILGGKVTLVSDPFPGTEAETVRLIGVYSDTDICLGWTNLSDSITASGYELGGPGVLKIEEGKQLIADGIVYEGVLTEAQIAEIAGKTLTPPQPKPGPQPTPQPTPSKDDGKAADGTAVGKGADATKAAAAIMNSSSDEGPSGTTFAPLKVKSSKQTKNAVKLSWTKVKGAKKYVIFGNQCGKKNKMKKIATVSGKTYNVKKLKKGKPYKFIIMAVDQNNKVVSTSKTVHVYTKGKINNPKGVTVKKAVLSKAKKLKKGKTLSLKAKITKKGKVKQHRKVRYESTNTKVAVVTAKGKVKGVAKGSCYVYAYAQNGACKKIKVTVK